MNRKIVVFVVGLLALGALEFGLLGANAAGFGGGKDRLPPLAERSDRRTPVASPTPVLPPGADSIELHRPDPDAIRCDGAHRSSLSVDVRDSDGKPAQDGTNVSFAVYNGSADPPIAQTRRGAASTSIVLYSDAYSSSPNVEVRSGDMETAIRVRCIPNSGCPLSPPPNASPPCGPTPFPCNPSPGAGPMSPPCEVMPPPCNPSPGIRQGSSPCSTPYPCNPSPGSGPLSPPCEVVPPLTAGGEISIGTPELIGGRLRVPINASQSPDPFAAFNVHLLWDGALASVVSPASDALPGDAFDKVAGREFFCVRGGPSLPPDSSGTSGLILGCFNIGPEPQGSTGPGTLAHFWLTPNAAIGCLPLRLEVVPRSDPGFSFASTYTISDRSHLIHANTYGPDVYVNIADGSACAPSACISFDPAGCGPEATPTPPPTLTPPGNDAQTATATALKTSTPAAASSQVAATSTATPGQRRR